MDQDRDNDLHGTMNVSTRVSEIRRSSLLNMRDKSIGNIVLFILTFDIDFTYGVMVSYRSLVSMCLFLQRNCQRTENTEYQCNQANRSIQTPSVAIYRR